MPSNRKSKIENRKFLALLVLLSALLFAMPARAQEPEPEPTRLAGTSPAPRAGADAVVFISQAVDAAVARNPSGTYRADNRAAIRLHNTSREADATVTFGWPGWPGGPLSFDTSQITGFAPYRTEGPLPIRSETHETSWAGESRRASWLVTDTTIGRDQRQRIFFDWSQPMGRGPLITYDFALLPAGAWSGPVGSARVTLTLPDLSSEEIIIRARPSTYTFNGTEIEWLLVEAEPTVNPSVTIIAPHLWQEIEQQRAAAATDPFGANLRLAELYDALATAGVAEYGDEAVAALESARRAQPDNPEPLRRLANRYRQEAEARGGDLALLEQAATAAEAAFAVGLDDPALRDLLVRDLQTLAEAWLLRDPTVSLEFLARAEAASPDPAALAARRASATEGVALAALRRGELDEARALAAEYGLALDFAPVPWLYSAALRVENRPGERVLRFTVSGESPTVEERMSALAERLTAGAVRAEWAEDTLTVRLAGTSDEWIAAGHEVAAALDDAPELDLLRDVLTPRELQYRTIDQPTALRYGYRESLHLETRAGAMATLLREEAEQRDSAWERALLEAAAARWEGLFESQRVRLVTTFEIDGSPSTREWALAVPSDEAVEWQGSLPRRLRWLQIGAAGAGILLLLLALIWLPGRQRG